MGDLSTFRMNMDWMVGQKLIAGRCSSLLRSELERHLLEGTLNVPNILREIGLLEGKPGQTNTKEASLFKRKWLRGLHHKHHMQARDLQRNIEIHHGRSLQVCVFQEAAKLKGLPLTQAALNEVSNRIINQPLAERRAAQKLTGEWIIFAKHEARNYFLTLANHSEDDQDVWIRAKSCSSEFPELPILHEDRSL